jgi:uncharacterized protein YbjT (DUF2867 family)
MAKTAIILGASGLVGSKLLRLLLEDETYTNVVAYVRKPLELDHEKLEVRERDLLDESAFADARCDDLFCCIGTTQAKTPDLTEYRKIDYGIPVNAARSALNLGMQRCLVISSMGAKVDSRTFYLRVKGQMEEALMKMGISELHILRPSLLLGDREEFRFGERVFAFLMKFFRWFIPKRYRAIEADQVAGAMMKLTGMDYPEVLVESDEIRRLASR